MDYRLLPPHHPMRRQFQRKAEKAQRVHALPASRLVGLVDLTPLMGRAVQEVVNCELLGRHVTGLTIESARYDARATPQVHLTLSAAPSGKDVALHCLLDQQAAACDGPCEGGVARSMTRLRDRTVHQLVWRMYHELRRRRLPEMVSRQLRGEVEHALHRERGVWVTAGQMTDWERACGVFCDRMMIR